MELIEKSLIDYVNQVDSDMPAPGGGSVAALAGALGVALAKMSAHFSVTKKKFKEASVKEQEKFILAFKELDYYKDMLIKGISMGSIDMEKKVSAYKDEVNHEDLNLAKEFMKFQERAIEKLKQYL